MMIRNMLVTHLLMTYLIRSAKGRVHGRKGMTTTGGIGTSVSGNFSSRRMSVSRVVEHDIPTDCHQHYYNGVEGAVENSALRKSSTSSPSHRLKGILPYQEANRLLSASHKKGKISQDNIFRPKRSMKSELSSKKGKKKSLSCDAFCTQWRTFCKEKLSNNKQCIAHLQQCGCTFKAVQELSISHNTVKSTVVVQWSKVQGSHKYVVLILQGNRVTEKLEASGLKKTLPNGLFQPGEAYSISVMTLEEARIISSSSATAVQSGGAVVQGLRITHDIMKKMVVVKWYKVQGSRKYVVLISKGNRVIKNSIARGRKKVFPDKIFQPGVIYSISLMTMKEARMSSSASATVSYIHSAAVSYTHKVQSSDVCFFHLVEGKCVDQSDCSGPGATTYDGLCSGKDGVTKCCIHYPTCSKNGVSGQCVDQTQFSCNDLEEILHNDTDLCPGDSAEVKCCMPRPGCSKNGISGTCVDETQTLCSKSGGIIYDDADLCAGGDSMIKCCIQYPTCLSAGFSGQCMKGPSCKGPGATIYDDQCPGKAEGIKCCINHPSCSFGGISGLCMDESKCDASNTTTVDGQCQGETESIKCCIPLQLCNTTHRSISIGVAYDSLILDGWENDDVSFGVSFASRKTVFNFQLSFLGDNEVPGLTSAVDELESIAVNDSLAFDTKLIIPNVGSSYHSGCLNKAKLHVTLPKTVKRICTRSECIPVLCPIAEDFDPLDVSGISFVPSNTRVLFGNSSDCSMKRPENWDEWIQLNFRNSSALSPESYYLLDSDNDGVSNIIEYYGLDLTQLFVDVPSESNSSLDETRHLAARGGVLAVGTDPNTPDSDGDLLTDYFELLYGLNPRVKDVTTADIDGDGLSIFEEQKYRTCPLKIDTDNDGISDYDEVQHGSDPLNDRHVESDYFPIKITVGDQSGSHSERYTITVGHIEHSSPEFGELNTATYNFRPGTYPVTVKHLDHEWSKKYPYPDYDYTAEIMWDHSSVDFSVDIDDTNPPLLGSFNDGSTGYLDGTSTDRTIGKQARITIKPMKSSAMHCSDINLCTECNAMEYCQWDEQNTFCNYYGPKLKNLYGFFKENPSDCACKKCEASLDQVDRWKYEHQEDLFRLPRCPCSLSPITGSLLHTVGPSFDQNVITWQQERDSGLFLCLNWGSYTLQQHFSYHRSTSVPLKSCCYARSPSPFLRKTIFESASDEEKIWHLSYEKSYLHSLGVDAPIQSWLTTTTRFHQCCKYCEDNSLCDRYHMGKKSALPDPLRDPTTCINSCDETTFTGIGDRASAPLQFDRAVHETALQAMFLSKLAYEEIPLPDAYKLSTSSLGTFDFDILGSYRSSDGLDQALVAKSKADGRCYGIFRGTEPLGLKWTALQDWISNAVPAGLGYICGGCGCCKGRSAFIESYFADFEGAFRGDILRCAQGCDNAKDCIILGGHSQGGAIATIAAVVFAHLDPMVMTFGQPAAVARDRPNACPFLEKLRIYRFINTVDSDIEDSLSLRHDPVPFAPGLGAGDFGHSIIISERNDAVASGVTKGISQFFDISDDYDFAPFAAHATQSYFDHLDKLRSPQEIPYIIPSNGWELGEPCGDNIECISGNCGRIFDFDGGILGFAHDLLESDQVCLAENVPVMVRFGCFEDAINQFSELFETNIESFWRNLNDANFAEATCSAIDLVLKPMTSLNRLHSTLTKCFSGIPMTVYFGVSGEGAFVYKGIGSTAYAVDSNDKRGCVVTGCEGGGLSAGVSASLVLGVGLGGGVEDLEGPSKGFDIDATAELGAGVAVQVGSTGMTVVEVAFSAGGNVNIFSLNGCETAVTLLHDCDGQFRESFSLSLETKDLSGADTTMNPRFTAFSTEGNLHTFHLPSQLPGRNSKESYSIDLPDKFGCIDTRRIVVEATSLDEWLVSGIGINNVEMNLAAPCNGGNCVKPGFWVDGTPFNTPTPYRGNYDFSNSWIVFNDRIPERR